MPRRSTKNLFSAFLTETSNETKEEIPQQDFSLPFSLKDIVPNHYPLIQPSTYRIALIGEAPGGSEVYWKEPFSTKPTPDSAYSGASGRFLNLWLSQAGILRDQCFVGNICQHRPPGNDIGNFATNGPEFNYGLEQLGKDLEAFQPNLCVLMGKTALWAAYGQTDISSWRGSLFLGTKGPFQGRKCLATFHPAACLRMAEYTPLFSFDLKKAKRHAESPNLIVPAKDFRIDITLNELLNELDKLLLGKPEISPDIEGGLSNMSCISLATSDSRSVLVPFTNLDGSSYWSNADDETAVWQRFVRIMADPDIKKCFQNGLYDRFVLQYGYDVVTNGCQDDTMLKFWEMWCELEKSLGFQCSILLDNEPYYKFERKATSREDFYRYCCKDSSNTFAINKRLDRLLAPQQLQHYRFNNDLLNPLLYMELRGMNYDSKLARTRHKDISNAIYEAQVDLDVVAEKGLGSVPREELQTKIRNIMCWKRDQNKVKAEFADDFDRCLRLVLGPAPLTKAETGYISTACKVHLNVDSYPQVRGLLYNKLGLPVQYKEDDKITSDYEAMLKLKRHAKTDAAIKVVDLLIDLGQLSTRKSQLEIKTDPDKRVRTGYNLVGTETGRITSYTSPTGSGYNLQTMTKGIPTRPEGHLLRTGMRDLFLADPGCYIFECDLSGADGWTIGMLLAHIGDRSMLDDLLAGIKPAARICFYLRHGNNTLPESRVETKKILNNEIKKDDWDYFACKQGIWGICYTMGPDKLITTIAKKSGGSLWLDRTKIESFRNSVFSTYRIRLLHDWAGREIRREPVLTAPNGFRRRFFGRPKEILGEYLAHLPQVITTYATNKALHNLWSDPENRQSNVNLLGSVLPLRIEPLHQVHDALLGQFRQEDVAWATNKIKSYFNNPITIMNQTITIPFEGSYGTNWALDKNSKVGDIV